MTALDPNCARRPLAERFGARFASDPATVGEADVVFHASATSQGLQAALSCCGTEASLVEVSWYGDEAVTVGRDDVQLARGAPRVARSSPARPSSSLRAMPPAWRDTSARAARREPNVDG